MFSTCSWLLPSWPSSSLYCFPYLRLHLFVLLVLTHCPGLLKLLQPPFHLVNKHSGSSEFQHSGLLTDSSSILHSWPRGGLWALSALWVQASPVIFDLCCCPTPAPWNYSSCPLVFAPTVPAVFWLPVLLHVLNSHSIVDWFLFFILLISLRLITYSHTGNGCVWEKLIIRRWDLGLISICKKQIKEFHIITHSHS